MGVAEGQDAHFAPQARGSIELERRPFWSNDIKESRWKTTKGMLMGLLIITLILWTVLPIFWGSQWLLLDHFNQLTVTVVDFDPNGLVGPMMVQMAEQTNSQPMRPHLGFAITQPSDYPEGVEGVKEAIGYSQYWGAIVVYPNCTSAWTTAIENGDSSYDPTGCVGIFYSGARFYQITLLYISTFMTRFANQVTQQASSQAVSQYLQSIQGNATAVNLLAQVPQALGTPFSVFEEDLRPINQWAVAAPFEAGLIYYLILSFILAMWGNAARQGNGWNKKLTFTSLYLWRIGLPAFLYFFISLSFTLQFKAFLIPSSAAFGNGGGFMALWMLNWAALLAVGLALESALSLLSAEFVPFFLICWIILNITSSFQPIEVMQHFYNFLRWLPFYHTVEGYKIIAYKTRPPHEIGLNYGALIGMIAVALIGNCLFLVVERRREEKAMKQEKDQ